MMSRNPHAAWLNLFSLKEPDPWNLKHPSNSIHSNGPCFYSSLRSLCDQRNCFQGPPLHRLWNKLRESFGGACTSIRKCYRSSFDKGGDWANSQIGKQDICKTWIHTSYHPPSIRSSAETSPSCGQLRSGILVMWTHDMILLRNLATARSVTAVTAMSEMRISVIKV